MRCQEECIQGHDSAEAKGSVAGQGIPPCPGDECGIGVTKVDMGD